MAHQILSVNFLPASNGSLDGYEAICSCGDRYRNTFESNVRRDGADHVAYVAAKAAKSSRKRVA